MTASRVCCAFTHATVSLLAFSFAGAVTIGVDGVARGNDLERISTRDPAQTFRVASQASDGVLPSHVPYTVWSFGEMAYEQRRRFGMAARRWGATEAFIWKTGAIEGLLLDHHEWKDVWARLPRNVMKSDIARYLVAYEYGGLYADYDVAAVGPLPEGDWTLCLQVEHTLKQWSGRLSSSREKQYLQRIAQYFFAVEPHHDFFRLVLDESLRRMRQLFQENRTRWDDKTVLWATGPDVFTTIYHEHFENDTSVFLAERGALAKHQHEGVWKKGRDMLASRRARRARRRSI